MSGQAECQRKRYDEEAIYEEWRAAVEVVVVVRSAASDAYERSGHVAPRPRSVPARSRSCRCSTFGSGTTSDTTGVIRRAATRRAACATSQRDAYRDPMMLISVCTMLRGRTSVATS